MVLELIFPVINKDYIHHLLIKAYLFAYSFH